MIIRSKISIGKEILELTPPEYTKRLILERLLSEMQAEISKKIEVDTVENKEQNSIDYTGEVAVITKQEYQELKQIEVEFYRLMQRG